MFLNLLQKKILQKERYWCFKKHDIALFLIMLSNKPLHCNSVKFRDSVLVNDQYLSMCDTIMLDVR